ncbi:MAG: thiamine-phosphate kinase [Candidatus Geothermarchaeota archaeon]
MPTINENSIIELASKLFNISILDDIGICKVGSYELALNIDTFVKSTDAPSKMKPYYIGWKSVVSSLSDLYVKGVKPLALLVSLGLNSTVAKHIDEVLNGIKDASEYYQVPIAKWDTNKCRDMFISVASIGKINGYVPLRKNAKVGDVVVVSGYFGLEGLGLSILQGEIKVRDPEIRKIAIESFCMPKPNFKKYEDLIKIGINASIDSSDGLARSLWILSKESFVKIKLFKIPVHPLVEKAITLPELRRRLALYSGEEYIGIFMVPKDKAHLAEEYGFIPIGEAIDKGIGVYDTEGNLIEDIGYVHRIG